jgi:hypothetical protein
VNVRRPVVVGEDDDAQAVRPQHSDHQADITYRDGLFKPPN